MHLRAWYETYDRPGSGVDAEWIAQHLGQLGTAAGAAGWATEITAAQREPGRAFCRVVRPDADTRTRTRTRSGAGAEIHAVADGDIGVVGFLYGHRTGAGAVTLGPMYLLDEVQGTGVAHALMREFLDWAGATPIRLWVSAFNTRAVRFYAGYGFVATGARELWRDRLLNLRMVRPSGAKL